VVRDFLNVRVNQNAQVTDASVRNMELPEIYVQALGLMPKT
jgi:hypothetical protein